MFGGVRYINFGHEDRDKFGVLNPQMANFRFDAFGLVCVFILEDQLSESTMGY